MTRHIGDITGTTPKMTWTARVRSTLGAGWCGCERPARDGRDPGCRFGLGRSDSPAGGGAA